MDLLNNALQKMGINTDPVIIAYYRILSFLARKFHYRSMDQSR